MCDSSASVPSATPFLGHRSSLTGGPVFGVHFKDILPKGTLGPVDTKIYIDIGDRSYTESELLKIQEEITKELRERYDAIKKKQDAARRPSDPPPSADFKDLIYLADGIAQGAINAGFGKINARINGALADWFAKEAWGLDKASLQLKGKFDIEHNKNWQDHVKWGVGAEFTKGRLSVSGMSNFVDGRPDGYFLMLGWKY